MSPDGIAILVISVIISFVLVISFRSDRTFNENKKNREILSKDKLIKELRSEVSQLKDKISQVRNILDKEN